MHHIASTRRPASPRSAFTLIELLTVIAIIGILAAILIPTVGAVRESARSAACASNLRQIAMAVLLFTESNGGRLPGSNTVTINRGVWNPEVNTTNFANQSVVESSAHLSTRIAGYLGTARSGALWRCPSNSEGARLSNEGNPTREITYILNQNRTASTGMVPPSPFGTSAGGGVLPARLSDIRAAAHPDNPGVDANGRRWSEITELSRIWMISDADSINYGGFSGYPAETASNAVPMAHRGGRNYAFFDGRVQYFKASNLPANP